MKKLLNAGRSYIPEDPIRVLPSSTEDEDLSGSYRPVNDEWMDRLVIAFPTQRVNGNGLVDERIGDLHYRVPSTGLLGSMKAGMSKGRLRLDGLARSRGTGRILDVAASAGTSWARRKSRMKMCRNR